MRASSRQGQQACLAAVLLLFSAKTSQSDSQLISSSVVLSRMRLCATVTCLQGLHS